MMTEKMIRKTIDDFKEFEIGLPSGPEDDGVISLESRYKLYKNEQVIDNEDFLPVHFLEEGALVQKAVCRVRTNRGFGSGALISRSLFITNNHVIRNKEEARQAKFEFNYQLHFNKNFLQKDIYAGNPDEPIGFFYTNPKLDYTILRLKPHVINEATSDTFSPSLSTLIDNLRLTRLTQLIFPGDIWGNLILSKVKKTVGQRVNIIQHPRGGRKVCCIHSNILQEIYENVIRYTTDTKKGSSGSAVFDNEWEFIALHHAAGTRNVNTGKFENNEGIRIDTIIKDLQNKFHRNKAEILAELGLAS